MKSSETFLDVLKRSKLEKLLPKETWAGTATQPRKAVSPTPKKPKQLKFGFATGIECSNPTIAGKKGRRVRRDQLEECGHYRHWREDLRLVSEMGIPVLRYGLPNHRIHLGPDKYDWSFADEVIREMERLGIMPILDLLHFGVPDWLGDFQNPELPLHFARYAGEVAKRYPWARAYTPVNEVYVASRNSGWDGLWNERLQSGRGFVTALKHLVAAHLMASAAIHRQRPNALIITSESAEYNHQVTLQPSREIRLRNKLIFVSLDLLYSHPPDADVLIFLYDNGMSPEEFKWFMNVSPSGYQIMGNDYYGQNEHLVLPDGSTMHGEDVLGWYLVTSHYYHRYHKPVMHTETNVFDPDVAPRWLWKQWANVLRIRRDGVPVMGFTWYSLCDQIDWDTQLAEKNDHVNACGLFDLKRKPRPVAKAYRELINEFGSITALAHGEIFQMTRKVMPQMEL